MSIMKNMKAFLSLLIVWAMILTLFPNGLGIKQVNGASTTNLYGIKTDSNVIVGYDFDKMSAGYSVLNLDTNNSIANYTTITAIGNGAFFPANNGVNSCPITVVKGGTYTSIGNEAFRNCQKLTTATLPNTVTQIGTSVFRSCVNLTTVQYPSNLTDIPNYTFASTKLSSFTVSKKVTGIGDYAFYDCKSLGNITFESGSQLKAIGNYAFAGTVLTNITIPKGVTKIGSAAFLNCAKLESVTIPEGVTTIESNAFGNCKKLTNVIVPSSVTSMGDNAFDSPPPFDTSNLKIITSSKYVKSWCDSRGIQCEYKSSGGGSENTTTYKITYTLNGGKNHNNNPSGYKKTTADITLKGATRSGYHFDGWYKEASYKNKVTKILKGSTGDLKLYAKWNKVDVGKAKINKLTNKKGKKLVVNINPMANINGYLIEYAKNSKFKNAKTVNISGKSKTLKNLKKGKTYYVRVKAYQLDSTGEKVYGNPSVKKKLKIKK